MNMRLVKRIIAATLAATLMVAPAITAGAATTQQTEEASAATATPSTPAAPKTDVQSTSTVSLGGVTLKSTVEGAYYVKTLAGVAIRQDVATIKAAAGLGAGEKPFVRVYDITAAKSPAAFATANIAAASVGATVLGAVNVDFGKLVSNKFSQLSSTVAVPATFGVANAAGRTLAVVKILPGGAFEILPDQDTNPLTVTVNITGGFAAYAVIAY